ncbi:MAG: hypothetical protein R3C14_02765 [Caldilineaceae bacterium]
MLSNLVNKQLQATQQPVHRNGLPVRTNLRAGLAWDDLDDQAKALWNQLTSAVSSAADAVKTSVTPTQSA